MLVERPDLIQDNSNMEYPGEFETSDFTAIKCPEGCGSNFSSQSLANSHARQVHHKVGTRIKFYYLVRHIKAGNSPYPATRQIVYHDTSESRVEQHLELVQTSVHMPVGCTYSIEHF